jgi:electron transport complex protein RnfB
VLTVDAINALLPQTQCGECSYSGCLPYATALFEGKASIDRCPPGGVSTLRALAMLLEQDPSAYEASIIEKTRAPSRAVIREAECIGCTKCIQACPVDAIIGSGTQMHAVWLEACTGCGLCVEPCPVDCIEMEVLPQIVYDKHHARLRYVARQARLSQKAERKIAHYQEKRRLVQQVEDKKAKQAYILDALARVSAKRHE